MQCKQVFYFLLLSHFPSRRKIAKNLILSSKQFDNYWKQLYFDGLLACFCNGLLMRCFVAGIHDQGCLNRMTFRHSGSNSKLGESSARYSRLRTNEDFCDLQFREPPPRIPWKAIGLATVLFISGSVLILLGSLLLAGVIGVDVRQPATLSLVRIAVFALALTALFLFQYADRTWPLLILGSILFIPGAYHVRIAYYAYHGREGYSFDEIPDFD